MIGSHRGDGDGVSAVGGPVGESVSRELGVVLLLAVPALARGAAWDVEARTEAQADTVAAWSPGSGRALSRRRLVQDLDLAGFEVVPGEDAGLSLQIRVDADFAVNDAELGALDDAARDRLQLLAARFHWSGLAGGRLDVEAGRLTAQDAVGFWRFDGGKVTVRPLPWLSVAAFGGLRVTGSSWLGSSAFAPDGTRESDRRRIAAGVSLCSLSPTAPGGCADATLDDPAPTWGGRVELGRPGATGAGAALEYRRTTRAGSLVEDRLGAGARLRVGSFGADAGGEVDLYVRRLSELRAGLRWAATPGLEVTAEAIHSHPTFEAGSLWNLFDTAPTREARLRADLATGGGSARAWAAAGVKRYDATAWTRELFGDGGGWEPFGALGGSLVLDRTRLSADVSVRGGTEGTQGWASAVARQAVGAWVGLEARATVARMVDRVAPKNSGTFPALALLVTGRLERRARIGLLLEDSSPRGERNDVRLFAFLALGADWNSRMAR